MSGAISIQKSSETKKNTSGNETNEVASTRSRSDYKIEDTVVNQSYYKWANSICPLFNRKVFDEWGSEVNSTLTDYFIFHRYLFIWSSIVLILGMPIFAVSFYTIDKKINPAIPVCKEPGNNYYMCPTCDHGCDFWYLKDALPVVCGRQFRLLFDNPLIWGYACLVLLSAVILGWYMVAKHPRQSEHNENVIMKSTKKTTCCISIFILVMISLFFIAIYFCFFLLILKMETIYRLQVHKTGGNISIIVITNVIIGNVCQAILLGIVKQIYTTHIVDKYFDHSCTHRFAILFVYNSITSYVPVLYRIYMIGNIVGDPASGYRHIGGIRFEHCEAYGCIHAAIHICVVMFISQLFPIIKRKVVKCIKKYRGNDEQVLTDNESDTETEESIETQDLYNAHSIAICDLYIDLAIIYGYTVFFLTVSGYGPPFVAVILLPIIARSKSQEFLNAEKLRSIPKDVLRMKRVWICVYTGMTIFSMFTNLAHLIPNSRFIQHVSYSTGLGHSGAFLNFDGYLDVAIPKHSLIRLIDIHAFPNYDAHYLTEKNQNGNSVTDESCEKKLYLPFVDFNCLKKKSNYSKNYFTRQSYINFVENNLQNNPIVRYNNKKQAIGYNECFNYLSQCRSRGLLSYTKEYQRLQNVRKGTVWVFLILLLPSIIICTVSCLLWKCCSGHNTSRDEYQSII